MPQPQEERILRKRLVLVRLFRIKGAPQRKVPYTFPRFRVFTWIILAINALFLIWIITGIASNNSTAADCGSLDRAACEAAENVGTAIGVGLIVGLWVAADVILGVLWLITRRKTRDCPACGRTVKRGQLQCKSCGYDFGQAARAAQQPPVSPVA